MIPILKDIELTEKMENGTDIVDQFTSSQTLLVNISLVKEKDT